MRMNCQRVTSQTGGTTMNNKDLVAEVANQTSLTKNTSMKALDTVISVVGTSLNRKEKVTSIG